jgi:hypothetical protein
LLQDSPLIVSLSVQLLTQTTVWLLIWLLSYPNERTVRSEVGSGVRRSRQLGVALEAPGAILESQRQGSDRPYPVTSARTG